LTEIYFEEKPAHTEIPQKISINNEEGDEKKYNGLEIEEESQS
jgi:hypothetical protein